MIKLGKNKAATIILLNATIFTITFSLIPDMDIAAVVCSFFVITVLSVVAYRKIKIIPLSAIYGILAILTGMLSGHLTSAVYGFVMESIFESVNREALWNSTLMSAIYLFTVFAIGLFISRKTGKFLHKQMQPLDDILKKQIAKYILVGAMIILALFFINTFLHDFLTGYAVLLLVYAVSLSICFGFLVFSIFAFANSVRKESEIHYKNEMLQNLQSYNITVEDMATEMRRFRHDHMNMLLGFHEYIDSNDIKNIHNYFKQYMAGFSEATTVMESQIDELKNVKRPEIKSILSAKMLYAQQLGITVNIEVPDEIEFADVSSLLDFCRITGIFLDNAIDACRGLDNATLRFMAIKKSSEILFVFMNTCDTSPDMARLGDRGYTTKEGQRGLGLYTARQLIEKNSNLALSTLVQDGMFVQELSLLQ